MGDRQDLIDARNKSAGVRNGLFAFLDLIQQPFPLAPGFFDQRLGRAEGSDIIVIIVIGHLATRVPAITRGAGVMFKGISSQNRRVVTWGIDSGVQSSWWEFASA